MKPIPQLLYRRSDGGIIIGNSPRAASASGNGVYWTAPSAGFYREHFVEKLRQVISEKDSKLSGYSQDCKEQWLLVVAENSNPSTFYDPSEATVNHSYKSAFDKVFVMELFKVKLFELKLAGNT